MRENDGQNASLVVLAYTCESIRTWLGAVYVKPSGREQTHNGRSVAEEDEYIFHRRKLCFIFEEQK
jgi:hypothetical protein